MEFLNKDNIAEYEEFNKSHKKGHFCQSFMWSKVKIDWDFEVVLSRNSLGDIVGAMAVLIRKVPKLPYSIMYSPRGPVCDIHDKEVLADLMSGIKVLANRYNAYTFKIDPDVKSSDKEFIETMRSLGLSLDEENKNFDAIQPRYVFRLDVQDKSEEEIMASFHEKWRYNIRLAARKGVEVKIAGREELESFEKIMRETGERDGFITRGLSYFERMADELGEHMRLYMAYYEGKPIAGTIAILYGNKVWYLYGASSNEHRKVMPNYLLQWEMIKWSIEEKCDIYDFRGVSGDISEDNPLYGLYKFKKGFNGEFTEFCGEFEIIFKPFVNKSVDVAKKVYRKVRKLVR